MHILTVNSGSSSEKIGIFKAKQNPEKIFDHKFDFEKDKAAAKAFKAGSGAKYLLKFIRSSFPELQIDAVGHRVVQSGQYFDNHVRIKKDVIKKLKELIKLNSLHMPAAVNFIEKLSKELPKAVHVTCFDTVFHKDQPRLAKMFSLPKKYFDKGIMKYGFHGLSYENCLEKLKALSKKNKSKLPSKIVALHLGSGASACAIKNGKSIATTMSFSVLDGLMMATRPGSLDAGAILYLLKEEKMSVSDLEKMLFKKSGLLGVSGISSDIRTLLKLRKENQNARDAIDLFCYMCAKEVGGLITCLGGVDEIIFTGGIGENSPEIRKQICEYFSLHNVLLDVKKNISGDALISASKSKVKVRIIQADEKSMIAKHTYKIFKTSPPS